MLSVAQGARCVADLLTELVQIVGDGGFSLIGEAAAAAHVVRAALQAGAEILLIYSIERAPQLAGGRRLRGREFARGGAHLLSETRQVIGYLLAVIDQFVYFLGGRVARRLAGGARCILVSH
jgi:hypothetical protein